MDSLNNPNDKKNFSLALQASSNAVSLIENQENKAEFFRNFFDDFATVNGVPKNYAQIPKKERLRKFFGDTIPRQEIQQTVQEGISRMEEDKKLPAYVVEYVRLWMRFAHIFLPDRTFICFISQFIIPNVMKWINKGISKNSLDKAFIADMKAFEKQFLNGAPVSDVKAKLETREEMIGLAERMFIQLVHQWFCLPNTDCGYPAEKVADIVLEFMKSYIKDDYYNDMFMAASFTSFVTDKVNMKPATNPSPAA